MLIESEHKKEVIKKEKIKKVKLNYNNKKNKML